MSDAAPDPDPAAGPPMIDPRQPETDIQPAIASLPVMATGLAGRCPRCGKGRLFTGFITVRPSCNHCGLDFAFADAGDGPAVFITFIVGTIVVALALVIEFTYEPSLWVHAMLWLPAVVILSLAMLRPLKGLMIALQYRHKAEQGRFEP